MQRSARPVCPANPARRARTFAGSAVMAVVAVLALGTLAACGGSDRPEVVIGTPGTGGSDSGSGSGEPGGSGPAGTDGGLTRCRDILRAYGSLAATAAQGQEAAANARDTLEGLAGDLPADLQDDLAVVADAFGKIASDGVVQGASALTTSEFREANENILGYLRDDCLPG